MVILHDWQKNTYHPHLILRQSDGNIAWLTEEHASPTHRTKVEWWQYCMTDRGKHITHTSYQGRVMAILHDWQRNTHHPHLVLRQSDGNIAWLTEEYTSPTPRTKAEWWQYCMTDRGTHITHIWCKGRVMAKLHDWQRNTHHPHLVLRQSDGNIAWLTEEPTLPTPRTKAEWWQYRMTDRGTHFTHTSH